MIMPLFLWESLLLSVFTNLIATLSKIVNISKGTRENINPKLTLSYKSAMSVLIVR